MTGRIRRVLSLVLILCITFSMTGCFFGRHESVEEQTEATSVLEPEEGEVGIANPMREIRPFEVSGEMGFSVDLPRFSSEAKYFVYDLSIGKMLEVQFVYERKELCLRAQLVTDYSIKESEDISGLYFNPNLEKEVAFRNTEALIRGGDGMGYETWIDSATGIHYCLGMSTGFDENFIEKVATLVCNANVKETARTEAMDIIEGGKVSNHEEGELDGEVVCYADYDTFSLSEEDTKKYPELANKVSEISVEISAEYKKYVDSTLESYEEDFGDMSWRPTLYSSISTNVIRADEVAFTLVHSVNDYYGGAHGMYGVYADNIDTATGENLEFSEVVFDIEGFKDYVAEDLIYKYGENEFYDLDSALDDTFADISSINWMLGYNGVTIYFGPYVLAPYASGDFYATVYFDEAPRLFNEKYLEVPEVYVVPEINGDFFGSPGRDYDSLVDGLTNDYRYGSESYIVHRKENDYALVFCDDGVGYADLNIYSIDSEAAVLVYVLPGVSVKGGHTEYFFTDPNELIMIDRVNMIKPMGAYQKFCLYDDGELLYSENNYVVADIATDEMLTTKCNLSFTKAIPDNEYRYDTTSEQVIVNAGTKLKPLYTDGYYEMVLADEDNNLYYMEATSISDYEMGFRNMSYSDCFEEAISMENYYTQGNWYLSQVDLGGEIENAYSEGYEGGIKVDKNGVFDILIKGPNGNESETGLNSQFVVEYINSRSGIEDFGDDSEWVSFDIESSNPDIKYYGGILDSNKVMKIVRVITKDKKTEAMAFYLTRTEGEISAE